MQLQHLVHVALSNQLPQRSDVESERRHRGRAGFEIVDGYVGAWDTQPASLCVSDSHRSGDDSNPKHHVVLTWDSAVLKYAPWSPSNSNNKQLCVPNDP